MMFEPYVAVIALFGGAWMAFRPQRQVDKVEKRIAEGDDRYFEEQRSYAAYPKLRDPRSVRLKGQILVGIGVALLAIWWIGKP